jgi:hypothetical protein
MATTYKIMNVTKDKQLIGQDITLTKKGVKDGVVHFSDLKEALLPIYDKLGIE